MIGNRIKDERERLGLSQPAFGELAGAAKRTVIDWEKGVSSPTAQQLAALSEAGADVRYIVTGDRDGPPPEVLTTDERELLALYRTAPLAGKMAAVGALQGAVASVPVKQVQKIKKNAGQLTQSGNVIQQRGTKKS